VRSAEVVMNPISNSMVIVIGASARGMAALKELVAQFPQQWPARSNRARYGITERLGVNGD